MKGTDYCKDCKRDQCPMHCPGLDSKSKSEAQKPEAVKSNSTDWLCDEILTPIKDCSYQDKDDGCCSHDANMTPECHHGACPRLSGEILSKLE